MSATPPAPRPDLAAHITAECDRLGLEVAPAAVPRIAAYAESLWLWNERLNLTRHTDVERFVSRDAFPLFHQASCNQYNV